MSAVYALLTLLIATLLWSRPWLASIALIVVSVLAWLQRKSQRELVMYIMCAVGGGIAETLAISGGAWSYAMPTFLGTPIWLVFVWGMAGIYVYRFSQIIEDFFQD